MPEIRACGRKGGRARIRNSPIERESEVGWGLKRGGTPGDELALPLNLYGRYREGSGSPSSAPTTCASTRTPRGSSRPVLSEDQRP